jgi:hypothetical protein
MATNKTDKRTGMKGGPASKLPVLPPVPTKAVNYGPRARNGKGQSNQYRPGK